MTSCGQLLNRSFTPIKALLTPQFDALPVEPLKKLKWVEVEDSAVAAEVITVDHVKCLTPLVLTAGNLAKFRSNHGWTKMVNPSNQSIATIASNQ